MRHLLIVYIASSFTFKYEYTSTMQTPRLPSSRLTIRVQHLKWTSSSLQITVCHFNVTSFQAVEQRLGSLSRGLETLSNPKVKHTNLKLPQLIACFNYIKMPDQCQVLEGMDLLLHPGPLTRHVTTLSAFPRCRMGRRRKWGWGQNCQESHYQGVYHADQRIGA